MLKYTSPCDKCGRIYAYIEEDISTKPIFSKVIINGKVMRCCESCSRDAQTEEERKKEELSALIKDRF